MTFSAEPCLAVLGRGDFADAYFEESEQLSLRWEEGRLDDVARGASSGIGLRFERGEETLYARLDCRRPVSAPLAAGDFARLRASAARIAGHLPARRARPELRPRPARRHAVETPPAGVPLEDKIALLRRAEGAVRGLPLVRQVTVTYGERLKRVAYVNSLGETFEEDRVYVVFVAQVTAGSGGRLQTGYESLGGLTGHELFRRMPPERVAELAARRAVAKLKAPPAPLGEMPVVIASQAGGTLIHEAIGHALEADGIQQGTSPHFAGKVGKVVANEIVTVLDDPTRPGQRGSFFYDDEGTPSEGTVLVKDGVLQTYLYDRRSARKAKRASNGHGRRESYEHKPIPRMSNTFIAPGAHSPQDIVRSLKSGLYVTRMGGGQVNTATGDFVFEVEEGFRVKDGRVLNMVRGANLLGNGPEVLRTIDRVGNDIGWSIGTCGKDGQGVPVSDGVPTLRIPKVVVGGTERSSK